MIQYEDAHNRWAQIMEQLRQRRSIDDLSVIECVQQIREVTKQTNCNTAATIFCSRIGGVLYYRPHLAKQLLQIAVHPLVMMGFTCSNDVTIWLENDIMDPTITPFYEYSTEARQYLLQILDNSLLQVAIDDCIQTESQRE